VTASVVIQPVSLLRANFSLIVLTEGLSVRLSESSRFTGLAELACGR